MPKYILRYSLLFSFMESLEFYWSLKLEGSAWEILVLQKKNSRYLDLPLRLLTFISFGNAKYFPFRTNWVTIVGCGTGWETIIISSFFPPFHLQNIHCKVEFTGKGWQTIIFSSSFFPLLQNKEVLLHFETKYDRQLSIPELKMHVFSSFGRDCVCYTSRQSGCVRHYQLLN